MKNSTVFFFVSLNLLLFVNEIKIKSREPKNQSSFRTNERMTKIKKKTK